MVPLLTAVDQYLRDRADKKADTKVSAEKTDEDKAGQDDEEAEAALKPLAEEPRAYWKTRSNLAWN